MSVRYTGGGSRVVSADAVALARAIHDAAVVPHPRRCPLERTIDLLFFKNSAGSEAVAAIGGCTGTWDGTRLVDLRLPFKEAAPAAPSSS